MPRSIGPGCMMMASFFIMAARCLDKPNKVAYSRCDGKNPPFMRSCCTRNIITTSASETSESRSTEVFTGQPSTPKGNSVGGATKVTSAPRADNRSTLERTTRECKQSPTILTLRPEKSPVEMPRRCRMVIASNNAWVGCWWEPSPALMTDGPSPPGATHCATCWAAPDEGWRMIIESAPKADKVIAVSRNDSPFFTEEDEADRLITSADIHLPAVSKEARVRVEFS